PASDAAAVLPDFARQARIQIVAPADQLDGVRTSALHGSMDVRAALDQLLVGTGLRVASDDGRTIALGPVAGEATLLAAVGTLGLDPQAVPASGIGDAPPVEREEVATTSDAQPQDLETVTVTGS